MGKIGAVSRLAGSTFGSAVTFGAAQKTSAPGQIDANELRKVLVNLDSLIINIQGRLKKYFQTA